MVWAAKAYFSSLIAHYSFLKMRDFSCCRLVYSRCFACYCARIVITIVVVLVLFLLMFFIITSLLLSFGLFLFVFFSILVSVYSIRRYRRRHSFIFVGELIATEMKNIKWLDLWRREVKIRNRVWEIPHNDSGWLVCYCVCVCVYTPCDTFKCFGYINV